MKDMVSRLFNKLFFLVSIVVVLSFSGGSMEASGQFSNTSQEDAPTAVAITCSSLLEGCARNPSVCDNFLIPIYNDAVDDILALNLESSPDDIAVAKGTIKASLITSMARNPSLENKLLKIEAICDEDIEAF